MKTEIKRACEKDIPVLESILQEAARWMDQAGIHQWEKNWVQWDGAVECLSTHYRPEDFYIAYRDEKPVGCVAVLDHDPVFWANLEKGQALYIHKLAVRRCVSKQGVSDALVNFVKDLCRQKRSGSVRLDMHANRPKLSDFYRKHGFVCVDRRIPYEGYNAEFYVWSREAEMMQ